MDGNHVQALHAKHAGIDRRIHEEEGRPSPDFSLIARLKKEKLRIKEEIYIQ
ncbi:MAG: YdcH family protein [Blastomonas sp.]